MPILTYGGQNAENEPQATTLLTEGDRLLEAGDELNALECYVKAADLVREIPADYAYKAGKLALLNEDFRLPNFETLRIAAAFFEMVGYGDSRHREAENSMFKAYSDIRKTWKRANLVPLPHIVFPGEGGRIYLLELVWNENGNLAPEILENTVMSERVHEFISKKNMYGIGISSFYDDDDPDVFFDPIWQISASINSDEQIQEWLKFNCRGSVGYVSPTVKPAFEDFLAKKGINHTFKDFEPIAPSMEWYKNVCCW